MHGEGLRSDSGMIKIHKNVISSIAALAASEIEGIKRVGSAKNGILGLLNKNSLPSIKVVIEKNDEVKMDIPLVIKYDYNIPEVSNKVQESVRQALERMTNLTIKEININVQAIERG